MTVLLAPPNGELVAQAWIAHNTTIPAAQIASRLPALEEWTDDGFLQVRALTAGNPHPELGERRATIVQLDAWGARKSHTVRPMWGVAAVLLERVRAATFRDGQTYGRPLAMPISGYLPARPLSGYLATEPRRIEGDPSAYARMTVDLAIDWTV